MYKYVYIYIYMPLFLGQSSPGPVVLSLFFRDSHFNHNVCRFNLQTSLSSGKLVPPLTTVLRYIQWEISRILK